MSLKVLWLSNVDLNVSTIKSSGTWIYSMFNNLTLDNRVNICANITLGDNNNIKYVKNNHCTHYYIPKRYTQKNGLPSSFIIQKILNIIRSEKPDIIHVWGTEQYWGYIVLKNLKKEFKILLEIQGLKFLCGENVFYGGLYDELSRMRGIPEILYPNLYLQNVQKSFLKWGIIEKEMIKISTNVNVQSGWVRSVLSCIPSKAVFYNTDIILRNSFISSEPWYQVHNNNGVPRIFTITKGLPYKALHDLIKAFYIVVSRYPTAKLYIAGISVCKNQYKNLGYMRYILSLVGDLNLTNNIVFLGALDENDLKQQMYSADVFVMSSHIESYCLSLAEALSLGVPSVIAYSSALIELAKDNYSGLYYPVGDIYLCASKIIQILKDKDLQLNLSMNSSASLRERIDVKKIVDNQINTYLTILARGED